MRVVVADDEPLALADLAHLLRTDLHLDVVATCSGAAEVRGAIRKFDPDLVFLDIEMPGTNGLELARELEAAIRPLVVFVTAHTDYAFEAFDAAPVDYVVKPAEPSRCRRAVERARRMLEVRHEEPPGPPLLPSDHFFVKDGDRLVQLAMDDVDSLEALGNYVKIKAGPRKFVVRATLTALLPRLAAGVFVRIHRSHVINIRHVRELVDASYGDYNVVMNDGATVPLSRRYRNVIEALSL